MKLEVPPLLYSISALFECILSNQNACIMSNLQHNIQKLVFSVSALRSATYLMERERYYTRTKPELTGSPDDWPLNPLVIDINGRLHS